MQTKYKQTNKKADGSRALSCLCNSDTIRQHTLGLCLSVTLTALSRPEVQGGQGLRVQEVEGGAHGEEHVVVMALVQDDEHQVAHLETEQRSSFSHLRSHHHPASTVCLWTLQGPTNV